MHQLETEKEQQDRPNRDARGRLLPGHNSPGPGNPHVKRVNQLRSMMINSIDDGDFQAVFKKLIQMAKDGDIHAIKELFDRVLGKAKQEVDLGDGVALRRIIIETIEKDGDE